MTKSAACATNMCFPRSRTTGKERDSESGNDYFGARYYASSIGRWMSPDLPLADQEPADPQSWNLYAYVRNNPLNSIDNDGLLTILIPGTDWKGSGGWGPNNALFDYGNNALRGNCVQDCTKLLNWSGANSDIQRIAGAQMLRKMIAAHHFAPGEKLNIITHSHGGNVALAASHLGLSHGIDTLITLNKPQMDGDDYVPGNNVGNFYNLSAYGDIIQWLGSDTKISGETYDPNAVNKIFNTGSSNLRPHAALIWDDKMRNMWWNWFMDQQRKTKTKNGCTIYVTPNGNSGDC